MSAAMAPDTVDDDATIVIVHYDAQDDAVYWCGYTNGHDGQGWTAERSEAREFRTYQAAADERRIAKRWHPRMRITLRGSWMVLPMLGEAR